MIHITPVKDTPDQFKITLDNFDIFILWQHLMKDIPEDLTCDCECCKRSAVIRSGFAEAKKYIDDHQKENFEKKMADAINVMKPNQKVVRMTMEEFFKTFKP